MSGSARTYKSAPVVVAAEGAEAAVVPADPGVPAGPVALATDSATEKETEVAMAAAVVAEEAAAVPRLDSVQT
jgi:hypothetical protein